MPTRAEQREGYGTLLGEILEGEPLNERERDVLIWAARGLTAVETGPEMILSPETVKSYRKRAAAKLGARSGPHAVALAIVRGLISFEEVLGADVR